ncbi:MAG: hypothetical protein ACW99L_11050, partial [Promethearchaeota archaeon]
YLEKATTLTSKLTLVMKKFIERSIISIYLLRSDNPPLQTKIRKDAGFTANFQVKEIREHLGIPLPLQENKRIENDSINRMKQCIKCKKMLSYDKFSVRKDGNLRWECNECRNISNIINIWRKKITVAKFISMKDNVEMGVSEFLNKINQRKNFDIRIKCFNCNAGINLLPALQFHHIQKRLKVKGSEWNKLRFNRLEKIIKRLDQQECILLCANCHAMITATFFHKYKKAIFTEKIEEYAWQIKGNIKRWIRKKKIIEELYNGRCTKCQNTSIDKLPALQFHHLDPSRKKTYFSSDLRDITDTKKIKKLLIEEDCTCLCSNCHAIKNADIFNKYRQNITFHSLFT